MIKLVVADRLQIIREGVKALLTEDPKIALTGEASDWPGINRVLMRDGAQVLLTGTDALDSDTIQSVRCLTEHFPQVRILLFSMPDQENLLPQLLDAGAMGYLHKHTEKEELLFAVNTVAKGMPYICTRATIHILQRIKGDPVCLSETAFTNPDNLSKRELEVLHWIAQGYTNAKIAEKLFTSKRTIETHRQHILEKTHCNNTATLIKYAISRGLVQ